jgi:transposase-like protein
VEPISYKGHRFPPDVIRQAVWLYFRFTLSLRDVEELMAQRGIEVSYETIRCWTLKFGRLFAQNLRRGIVKANGFAKARLLLAVFQRLNSTFRALCAPPLSPQNSGDGDKNAGPTFLP